MALKHFLAMAFASVVLLAHSPRWAGIWSRRLR